MPYAFVIGVPDACCLLLVCRAGISVVHVENRVGGVAESRDPYPGHQRPGAARVFLSLVRGLGDSIAQREEDVVAGRLSVSREAGVGGETYQDGKVCLVSVGNLRVVNDDLLPVCPACVEPGGGATDVIKCPGRALGFSKTALACSLFTVAISEIKRPYWG